MRAYLANALFSEADQMFNKFLAKEIRKELPYLELYVPQENPALNDKFGYADSVTIFDGDNSYLDSADILIAVLDGVEIDSGVSAEIGRFVAQKEYREAEKQPCSPKYIYGLYTDVRQQGRTNTRKIAALVADPTENQFFYRNLYTIGAVKKHGLILPSVEALVNTLRYTHG